MRDDAFCTKGKSIFYNIQNFLCFQLSTAVAALVLITLSTALRLATPLNPMQILFINILMDGELVFDEGQRAMGRVEGADKALAVCKTKTGPPSQSLGVDPVSETVMLKPPRPKSSPVLDQRLVARILFSALMIVLGTLFVYVYEHDGSSSTRDQTMTFTSFVFLDLVSAVQNRGLSCELGQNRMLVLTCSISLLVQLALVYFPPLQAIFQTEALSARDLAVIVILAGVSASLHEVRRRIERFIDDRQSHLDNMV
jgi:P-type Ca2+ transporter type 2C